MITDFPEAKKEMQKVVNEVLRKQVKQNAPMLSLVNKKTLCEGDSLGVLYPDGRHTVNEMQYIESKFSVPQKDVPTLKAEEFLGKVTEAAVDMAGQMERGLFKKIDESMKEGGNTIPGNPELGPDSILTALEMITIDFEDDDREKPVRPSLVAAPAAVQKLMEQDAKATPEEKEEYKRREKEIFDKKYEEHLKDLASRKIID
jgi:hypothetical protein